MSYLKLKRRFTVLLFLTTLGCAGPLPAQENNFAQVDSLILGSIAANETAGAVLLISHAGNTVYQKAYGYAQQYQFGGAPLDAPVPMQSDTVFDLASLTKVFATTFGIMLLVDEGKISLDAPIHAYLPAFTGADKDSVTVRHLLAHTAGLSPWKPVYYHASSREDALAYIAGLPLAFPVGEARHYSDLGFMLLGYLIETRSGMPLDVYLHENLYGPLGLTHTGFKPEVQDPSLFAATSHGNPFEQRMVADDNFGYVCDEDPDRFTGWRRRVLIGEVNDGNAYHAHQGLAGHAGLFSTAGDLQVLLQLVLSKGIYGGRRYFSPETVEVFLSAGSTGHGLGWAMASDALLVEDLPPGSFGHTGFTGTYALGLPAKDLAIVLLTNRQHGGTRPDGRYPSVNGLRRAVVTSILERL